MGLPLRQAAKIGAYVIKKHLTGGKYPLVLMLEPLFRCNLACAGCGKIDYPDPILNQRLSVQQCMDAIDECGAPAVSIAGGEPLLHRDMPKIVEGFIARDKFVILCTKTMFREILKRGNGGKNWDFTNSYLFMDFLAGNQTYECTPWSMPLLTVFGWQKPCYLLGEGYVKSFKELMEGTEWEKYGVGKYEKCANCMVHCGFEGTAATDAIKHPLKMLPILMRGVKTEGPMAPEIDLSKQRPAEFTFSRHVEHKMSEIKAGNSNTTEIA